MISTGLVDMSEFKDDDNSIYEYNRCYYDQPVSVEDFPVMRSFQEAEVKDEIMTQCNGKQKCSPSVSHRFLGLLDSDKGYDQFLFAQVSCEQDEDMLFLKNVMGLVVSVLGLLICAMYRNSLTLFLNMNKINDKIFDAHLITLGDYSVTGKVSSSMYANFLLHICARNN